MRMTLVISSLERGGAERTASVLANAWAEQGHQVTLITLARDDAPAYQLHSAINLRQLRLQIPGARNILHGIFRQLRIVRVLRSALRQARPDAIVSFMETSNVLTLLAARGLAAAMIVTEHTHPAYVRLGWQWRTLRRLSYHRADALVCMTGPAWSWFQQRIKVKGCIIPNPVISPALTARNENQNGDRAKRIAIAMGRLSREKGFDLLLDAFSTIAGRHPDWSLKILGEGPLRNELETQIRKLNLGGRAELAGTVDDPFPLLDDADLFVFSSRFEGFGNALCEAMACGLPAISFDCPSGPGEIVRHEVDGLLVPANDVTALADAMDRLMSNSQERKRLAARAPEVVTRFGLASVLGLWDKLFADLLPKTAEEKKTALRES
jgi:glycosyltransferase involved in cell wall biosynthesis